MGIHEDVRNRTIIGDRLTRYVRNNPNILNETDPDEGLTPLAAAVVRGYTEEILHVNGETPLLLAAWKTDNNRARIIQLLLAKLTNDSVDKTCLAAENKTPLMFAIEKKDAESIRLLRKANASLTQRNNDGLNAKDMAERANDRTVKRALYPDKEQTGAAKLASMAIKYLVFVVTFAGKALKGVFRRLTRTNERNLNNEVNGSESPNKAQFVENVGKFAKENAVLERFFEGKENYLKEMAQKAVDLQNDPSTPICREDLLPKTTKVTLHQQVIYCDDSSSMKRDGRWNSQKDLVERITKITTQILPEGDGVALRFINQDDDDSSNLTLARIGEILQSMSWKRKGNTEIGTYLRSKILEPLVYRKLESKSLERPLLVSVITDGMPSVEGETEFVDAILECGNKLVDAGYPRDSVKFMVGQIGTGEGAANFLNTIKENVAVSNVVYCTTDQLDTKFAELRNNSWGLDRWLIETLFSPIKDRE